MSTVGVTGSTSIATASTADGSMSCSRRRSRSVSMVGCVAAHDGYSLTVMPPSTISHRRPRRSMAADRSRPALCMATSRPWGPSMACSDAVNPSRARSAASTPLRAASPPCSGLTIVPKFSFQAARLGRGDRQGASRRPGVEPHDAGRGGGGADGADGRGAVPAPLVVGRVHHGAERALHLEADDVGVEQLAPRGSGRLAGRQSGRDERRARMRQRHPAHVVEVERVGGGAVGERGIAGPGRQVGPEHGAGARSAVGPRHPLHAAGGRLPRPGEGDPDRVLHGVARRRAGGGRHFGRRDEPGEPGDGGHRMLPPNRCGPGGPPCGPCPRVAAELAAVYSFP